MTAYYNIFQNYLIPYLKRNFKNNSLNSQKCVIILAPEGTESKEITGASSSTSVVDKPCPKSRYVGGVGGNAVFPRFYLVSDILNYLVNHK